MTSKLYFQWEDIVFCLSCYLWQSGTAHLRILVIQNYDLEIRLHVRFEKYYLFRLATNGVTAASPLFSTELDLRSGRGGMLVLSVEYPKYIMVCDMGRCASQVLAGKRLVPSKGVTQKIKGFLTKSRQGSGKSTKHPRVKHREPLPLVSPKKTRKGRISCNPIKEIQSQEKAA